MEWPNHRDGAILQLVGRRNDRSVHVHFELLSSGMATDRVQLMIFPFDLKHHAS